jgi:inner membrane protease ATP23
MDDHTGASPPKPAPANAATADLSFYTWSTFFKALTGQATREETRQYLAARDIVREESDCKRCEESRDWLFQHSPIVRFMRQQVQELGADINSENVRCRRCTTSQSGGFDPNYGILLCANELQTKGVVEDTMSHEMVHAYDHLRFKVHQDNMQHQACTEVSQFGSLNMSRG